MSAKIMTVKFGKQDDFSLRFQLESTPIADLWAERMSARFQWPMDNPDRFYGFESHELEKKKAIDRMAQLIHTVNDHAAIIDGQLHDINDQDTLNYLHNIFEKYHGQLDKQTSDFWLSAPTAVRQALSDINVNVHRCESLRCGKLNPRFVCTWYGMPKEKRLSLALQEEYAVSGSEFGGVYLNYVEIGKTAKDMAYDNDCYMADEMFQPFTHYSADFRVDFYHETDEEIEHCRRKVSDYFALNRSFFEKFGIVQEDDVRIRPTKFKVAQLIYESRNIESIISSVKRNQYISSIVIE